MPIERSTHRITPEEWTRFSSPLTLPVTKAEALVSLAGRGGCLLVCAGIGVACLLSLSAFAGSAKIVLAALAVVLTGIGVAAAWPLPGVLFAAITGRERVESRTRVRRDAMVETWRIPARRVFATDFGEDTLSWLIEADDGTFVHVFGEESLIGEGTAWIPGVFTLQTVDGTIMSGPSAEGPAVPYIVLSREASEALSHPFVTGIEVLSERTQKKLRPMLEADAAGHAKEHMGRENGSTSTHLHDS